MISNSPKLIRRVIAEDPDWNLFIVPPLSDICLTTLIKSFSSYPVLTEIAEINILYAHKLIHGLPPNLPLGVTVPLIDNNLYWKNLYLERWTFCENILSGDLWKQCYLERYLSELFEKWVQYYGYILYNISYLYSFRFLLRRLLVVGLVLKWLPLFMYVCIYLLLCRLLVVGPVLKWLPSLQRRLLVVGPVLKWLAAFMYVCISPRHCPGKTVLD